MGGVFSQSWRPLPKNNQDTLDFLKSYRPRNHEASHLRILLIGPSGDGKSTFINSVDSVLQGRVANRAPTDQHLTADSFTKKFDPENKLEEGAPKYNAAPELSDRVHVLVTVVPACSVSLLPPDMIAKLRDIRLAATALEIPQLAILTKVDVACRKAQRNVNNIYKSDYLKEQVYKFGQFLGLPVNSIFLVKNYSSEISTNDATDAHILCALKQMVVFGEDYLNHLND
ncbi:interferon-induced protein 44-like isoform X2 [Oreochromis niloticus]|uniref:interferon-induced protein 44-like isoform X2 n=1 Tax=Oreochromis niloticus TaxID=8128 RepID=UPI000DF4BCC3|nr:interferon-induced protein 44-like isoform X2 [Oreochromis niloticus]